MSKSAKSTLIVLASIFIFGNSVFGVTQVYTEWRGTSGDGLWTTAGNWSNGLPFANDSGNVQGGSAGSYCKAGFKNSATYGSATLVSGTVVCDQMTLGGGSVAAPGLLSVTGSTVNVSEYITLGAAGTDYGTLYVSSGLVQTGVNTSNAHLFVGQVGWGRVVVSGTGQIVLGVNYGSTTTGDLQIAPGAASSGAVTIQDNGSITAASLSFGTTTGTESLTINGSGRLILRTNQASQISGWFGTKIVTTDPGKALQAVWDGTQTVVSLTSDKAISPTPSNGASNVGKNTVLSWIPGTGVTSHNIYFGTASPGSFQGNQTATTFNPGTLDLNTTYFWRIDEVFGPNTVTGDVWSFTTMSGQAKNPDPANGASNIAFDKILDWTAGPDAVSHDVYFGTALADVNDAARLLGDINGNGSVDWVDLSTLCSYWLADAAGSEPFVGMDSNEPVNLSDFSIFSQDWMGHAGAEFKGNQDSNSFNPGTLGFNTTYYWRVDEVNGPETIKGPVWSFTTPSGKALNPNPANNSTGAATTSALSWTAGSGASSHDVYFGTSNPPASQGNQSGTSFNPGTLSYSTTYYWRVDEVGAYGTITGDLWSFTTAPLNTTPINPYLSWAHDPSTSMVVNWYNMNVQGDSTVDYGLTNAYGSSVNVPTATYYHHVELTGLAPSTTYHYRMRSSDGTVSSDYAFTTSAANPTAFSFAVYGDPRGAQSANEPYYSRHKALCDWIANHGYTFAIETGDTVWGGCASVNYPTTAQTLYMDFYGLEANLAGTRSLMATMGNHEVQPVDSGGTKTYTYYYDLYTAAFPSNGTSGNTGRNYSFNYGNAHFVCLSSFQINDASVQAPWLSADLAAAKANPNIKWIFVYMHAPLHTTSGHPDDSTAKAAWESIFDQYHVDIVFAGHNHVYERSKSLKGGVVVPDGQGTIYMTCGLGGASFDSTGVTGDSSLFASLYSNNTLASCITINGNTLTMNAITNTDGYVRDTFTLTK